MKTSNFAKEVARMLLRLKAVQLNATNPFIWSSGLRSPIYCDNRKILSHWADRGRIKKLFSKVLDDWDVCPDAAYGVATAGIPWAVLIADEDSIDSGYVRAAAKSHGLANEIEGEVKKGQPTIVVEDLISTGSSSLHAVSALRKSGVDVIGLVSIFSYGFQKAVDLFAQAGVEVTTLCDFLTLLEVAKEEKYITETDYELLASWNQDPQAWSENFLLRNPVN